MVATTAAEPPPISHDAINADAERCVCGSMLSMPQCVPDVLRVVRPADFGSTDLRKVVEVIRDRHIAGDPIDAQLVLADLRSRGGADGDTRDLLLSIVKEVYTQSNAVHYAEVVLEQSRKRRLYDTIGDAWSKAECGCDSREVLNDLQAFSEDELAGTRRDTIEKFSLESLVATYPELKPPVIDGLLRQGETMNLIAAAKAGKSWLVYHLAACIAMGFSVFDRYPTKPGRVLLIDNELHGNTLASRIPKVLEAMNLTLHDLRGQLEVWTLRGNLKALSRLREDLDQIQPGEFAAIILDAKYRLIEDGAKETDNADEARFYNTIDQVAKRTEASVILIHHASKGDQSEKRVTDVGSGAGSQSRAADCHLILREHEDSDQVVLDAAVRSFPPVEPIGLRWAWPLWIPDESINTAKLKRPRTARQNADKAEDAATKQLIVKLLQGAKEPLSVSKVQSNLGGGVHRLKRLLGELVRDGELTLQDSIRGGNPCDVYAIAEGSKGSTEDPTEDP